MVIKTKDADRFGIAPLFNDQGLMTEKAKEKLKAMAEKAVALDAYLPPPQ